MRRIVDTGWLLHTKWHAALFISPKPPPSRSFSQPRPRASDVRYNVQCGPCNCLDDAGHALLCVVLRGPWPREMQCWSKRNGERE